MRIKQIQNMWLMIALNWIQPWQISTSKQQNDIQKKNGWEWKPNHMKMKRQYSIVIIPGKHSSSERWLLYPSSNLSSLLKKNPPFFLKTFLCFSPLALPPSTPLCVLGGWHHHPPTTMANQLPSHMSTHLSLSGKGSPHFKRNERKPNKQLP